MNWQRGCIALAVAWPGAACAEQATVLPVEQFVTLCGASDPGVERLPGEDVALADAPLAFALDLKRATSSRVVRIDDRYAMRAIVPSSADPSHAAFFKCALTFGGNSFSEVVDQVSRASSSTASIDTTPAGRHYASFVSGMTSFLVYEEAEGWISVYKMDILMMNIPPKYLKKGAKPAQVPVAQ